MSKRQKRQLKRKILEELQLMLICLLLVIGVLTAFCGHFLIAFLIWIITFLFIQLADLRKEQNERH